MALARSALAAAVVVRAAWTYFMTMTRFVSSTGKTEVETTPTWSRCWTKATSTPSSMEDGVLRPVPWDMSLSMSWRRRNNYAPQAAPTPYLGVEEQRVQSVEYEWQHLAGKVGCILKCHKQTQNHQKQCKTLKTSINFYSIPILIHRWVPIKQFQRTVHRATRGQTTSLMPNTSSALSPRG